MENETTADSQDVANEIDESQPTQPETTGETGNPDALADDDQTQQSQEKEEAFVTFDDEDAPSSEEPAPAWVKELRQNHRNTVRENQELRRQLEAVSKPKDEYIHLGEKPTLASVDYDDERFEQELTAWHDRKRQIDAQQLQRQQQQQSEQAAWNDKLRSYEEKKRALSFSDVSEVEGTVQSFLNVTQQGLIVQGADNPALIVYALGKNPKKLQEISAIKDPVQFAFAIAKLENKMSVKNRKATTKPETVLKSSSPVTGSLDNNLEKLREEAARTGDSSKVTAYLRKKRRAR